MSSSLQPHGPSPPGSSPWDFLGINIGVCCHLLLQGIILTRNRTQVACILHWWWILYHLSTREAINIMSQEMRFRCYFCSCFSSCEHSMNNCLLLYGWFSWPNLFCWITISSLNWESCFHSEQKALLTFIIQGRHWLLAHMPCGSVFTICIFQVYLLFLLQVSLVQ